MLIAKLRISLRDVHIRYNSKLELSTEKDRGTVLEDGKVVRGLGTHFENIAMMERYNKLTKESNAVRESFNRQFLRTPIEGTFIIANKGEAKRFVEEQQINPELDVSVIEFELGATNEGLDEAEMREWGKRVKAQLARVPLGRGEKLDDDGIKALETLIGCPMLSRETANSIASMIAQLKVGQMDKIDFRRSLEMLEVNMDQTELRPERAKIS